MGVKIDFKGLKDITTGLLKLEGETRKSTRDVAMKTAKYIQRNARMRIRPGGHTQDFTGTLKRNIQVMVEEESQDKIVVKTMVSPELRYTLPQEFGFRRHLVHPQMSTGAGKTIADWLRQKGKPVRPIYVKKPYRSTGYFMTPAAVAAISRSGKWIEQDVDDAIDKSGF